MLRSIEILDGLADRKDYFISFVRTELDLHWQFLRTFCFGAIPNTKRIRFVSFEREGNHGFVSNIPLDCI
jgi:hypothetical protein